MAESYRLTAEEMRSKASTDALASDTTHAIATAAGSFPVSIAELVVGELRFLLGHAWVGEQKLRQLITDTHSLAGQLAATERSPA